MRPVPAFSTACFSQTSRLSPRCPDHWGEPYWTLPHTQILCTFASFFGRGVKNPWLGAQQVLYDFLSL